jgi:PAS domain S-box-containing protein
MTLINCRYQYEAVNDSFCLAHRRRREEIIGQTMVEVWGKEAFEQFIQPMIDASLAGQEKQQESWFEFGVLGRRCIESVYYPYYGQKGKITHVAVVSRDTTAHRHLEKELLQAKKELEERIHERTAELLKRNEEFRDQLEAKAIIEAELRETRRRYESIFHANGAPMLLVHQGSMNIIDGNKAACEFYGYSPAEMQGKPMTEIDTQALEEIRHAEARVVPEKRLHFLCKHRLKNGEIRNIEMYSGPLEIGGETHFYSIIHDVTDRVQFEQALNRSREELEIKVRDRTRDLAQINLDLTREIEERQKVEAAQTLNELRLEALLQLGQMYERPQKEITEFVLEEAVRLTQSTLGFLAFVNEDTGDISIDAWSKQTMDECRVHDKNLLFRIEKAGVWAESIRQRRTIIINDFSACTLPQKGVPVGHVGIERLANTPYLVQGKCVALLAVANKKDPYNDADVRQLSLMIEGLWRLLQRRNSEIALQEAKNQLEHRVRERTIELANVVADLTREIGEREVAEQARQLLSDELAFRARSMEVILASSPDYVFMFDPAGRCNFASQKSLGALQQTPETLYGKTWRQLGFLPLVLETPEARMNEIFRTGKPFRGELVCDLPDKGLRTFEYMFSPVTDQSQRVESVICTVRDISDRKLQEAQQALSQKLESIGGLAAGIAHEINTPVQYLNDNSRFLRESFNEILAFFTLLDGGALPKALTGGRSDDRYQQMQERLKTDEMNFLRAEIPKALDQSLEGIDRITKIVQAMKEFSHPGVREKMPSDVNRAIQNTVTISKHEWKYHCDMDIQLAAGLPPMFCRIDEINQVVLNMIVNAVHSIEEAIRQHKLVRGTIVIATRLVGKMVQIEIADDGSGIPEAIKSRIFDPFFTTKGAGKGTGQGLSIAYDIIVRRHGGQIRVTSTPGQGAKFILEIPLTEGKKP